MHRPITGRFYPIFINCLLMFFRTEELLVYEMASLCISIYIHLVLHQLTSLYLILTLRFPYFKQFWLSLADLSKCLLRRNLEDVRDVEDARPLRKQVKVVSTFCYRFAEMAQLSVSVSAILHHFTGTQDCAYCIRQFVIATDLGSVATRKICAVIREVLFIDESTAIDRMVSTQLCLSVCLYVSVCGSVCSAASALHCQHQQQQQKRQH